MQASPTFPAPKGAHLPSAVRQLLVPQLEAAGERIIRFQREVLAMPATPGAAALLTNGAATGKAYFNERQRVMDRKIAGQGAEAVARSDSAFQPASQAYLASFQALSDFHDSDAGNGSASAQGRATAGQISGIRQVDAAVTHEAVRAVAAAIPAHAGAALQGKLSAR